MVMPWYKHGVDDEAGAGFLRPDALPDANQDVQSWNVVRSWRRSAINSLAQGPVTPMCKGDNVKIIYY